MIRIKINIMIKPYENSKNLVFIDSEFRQIAGEVRRYVSNAGDKAEALYRLLDYDDDYRFSLEECRLGICSRKIERRLIKLSVYKHYYGATIKTVKKKVYQNPDNQEVAVSVMRIAKTDVIDDSFLERKYLDIKRRLKKVKSDSAIQHNWV